MLPDQEWAPISGWALGAIGRFAEQSERPNFLIFASKARPLWRQAIYLAFALGRLEEPDRFLASIDEYSSSASRDPAGALADLLPKLSPREILGGSMGFSSSGLLAVLRRLDSETLRMESYRRLADWHEHSDPRASLLQRMVSLNQDRLDALEILDRTFWNCAALPLISTPAAALALNKVVDLVRATCSTATPSALLESATSMSGDKTINRWVTDWLRKSDRFPIPFAGNETVRPVMNAEELIDLGRRFGNCLGTHCLATAISGKISIVEYFPEPAVGILTRLDGVHWLINGVHVPRNKRPPDHLRRSVEAAIKAASPNVRTPFAPAASEQETLRTFLPWYDPGDFEFAPF